MEHVATFALHKFHLVKKLAVTAWTAKRLYRGGAKLPYDITLHDFTMFNIDARGDQSDLIFDDEDYCQILKEAKKNYGISWGADDDCPFELDGDISRSLLHLKNPTGPSCPTSPSRMIWMLFSTK
jgi:hypothetical protein